MEKILVFYGDKKLYLPKNSNFLKLKNVLLHSDKLFVKYFSYKDEKINESLLIKYYSSFTLVVDANSFVEYKNGKFRCKQCRRYIKLTKWICRHTEKCRASHIFKLMEKDTKIIEGGYIEKTDDEVIDDIISKPIENNRQKMLNRINDLLRGSSK